MVAGAKRHSATGRRPNVPSPNQAELAMVKLTRLALLASVIIAVGSTSVAAYTSWLAKKQLDEMRSGSATAERQAKAAQALADAAIRIAGAADTQAKAALALVGVSEKGVTVSRENVATAARQVEVSQTASRDQIKMMQDTAQKQMRSFLTIGALAPVLEIGKPIRFDLRISNTSGYVVRQTITRLDTWLAYPSDENSAFGRISMRPPLVNGDVSPGEGFPISLKTSNLLTAAQHEEIVAGRLMLFLVLTTSYEDQFSNKHSMNLCAGWLGIDREIMNRRCPSPPNE